MSRLLFVGSKFSCDDGRAIIDDAQEAPNAPMFALVKWTLPISTGAGYSGELRGEVINMSDDRDGLRTEGAKLALNADTRYAYSVARVRHLTAE